MFDALPEAFGSHRVVEALGMGRFGPVYRARHEATGLSVVIKVFDQGLTADQAERLAGTLEQLGRSPQNHPAIVPILAAGVAGEAVWVAEPWFDAVPLDIVMQRDGAMPVEDVLVRVTQAAAALDFAAAVGIHHGALHPRDLLLYGEQTLVAGLGVLQALSDAGLAVPMEGAYVSPQRSEGRPVSASDDIFSLAAITYELVLDIPVPARAELRSTTNRPAGIEGERFADLVERALSPDTAERPPTALAFAEALQQVAIPIPILESDSEIQIPDSHSATPIPDSHSEIQIPDSHSATPIPDSHSWIRIPGSYSATPIADSHSGIRIPDSHSATPIADSHSGIPIPDADSATPIRDSHSEISIPDFHSESRAELPIRSSESHPGAPSDLPLQAAMRERGLELEPESESRNRHRNPELESPTPNRESEFPNRNRESESSNRNRESESSNRNRESEFPNRNRESESAYGYWFVICATLAIGLLMGFAGGYIAGQRDATPSPYAAERPVARNQPSAAPRQQGDETPAPTGGRDYTESVVPAPGGASEPPAQRAAPQPESDRALDDTRSEREPRPEMSGLSTLQVDSRPRGARVFIDGRLVGTTPVLVGDVRPGPHAVRIDLAGHRRWVTTVDLGPGERQRVAASLER